MLFSTEIARFELLGKVRRRTLPYIPGKSPETDSSLHTWEKYGDRLFLTYLGKVQRPTLPYIPGKSTETDSSLHTWEKSGDRLFLTYLGKVRRPTLPYITGKSPETDFSLDTWEKSRFGEALSQLLFPLFASYLHVCNLYSVHRIFCTTSILISHLFGCFKVKLSTCYLKARCKRSRSLRLSSCRDQGEASC